MVGLKHDSSRRQCLKFGTMSVPTCTPILHCAQVDERATPASLWADPKALETRILELGLLGHPWSECGAPVVVREHNPGASHLDVGGTGGTHPRPLTAAEQLASRP